jgi:hypothetical protein
MKCPICNEDFKNLSNHLRQAHPEEVGYEQNTYETYTPPPKAKERIDETFNNIKKKLNEQNEILLLTIQQQALVKALSTGQMPGTEQPKSTSVSEALELIRTIRGEFPEEQQEDDFNSQLLSGAVEIFKAKMMTTTPPPPPLANPTPSPNEEVPEAPKPDFYISPGVIK